MVGGVESDYSVSPRPLLQFLQFFQFMSDRLCQVTQVTSGYVSLCRRDGTWSSTIDKIYPKCFDIWQCSDVYYYVLCL